MKRYPEIKIKIQSAIDLIGSRHYLDAITTLSDTSDYIDEMIDVTDDENALVEMAKYHFLIKHLQQKIFNAGKS